MRSKAIAALAAALMVTTAALPARGAQPLSLDHSPAVHNADQASDLGGRRGIVGYILAAAALGLLVFLVLEISKDNELPESA
jgi:hypothetical protein